LPAARRLLSNADLVELRVELELVDLRPIN